MKTTTPSWIEQTMHALTVIALAVGLLALGAGIAMAVVSANSGQPDQVSRWGGVAAGGLGLVGYAACVGVGYELLRRLRQIVDRLPTGLATSPEPASVPAIPSPPVRPDESERKFRVVFRAADGSRRERVASASDANSLRRSVERNGHKVESIEAVPA